MNRQRKKNFSAWKPGHFDLSLSILMVSFSGKITRQFPSSWAIRLMWLSRDDSVGFTQGSKLLKKSSELIWESSKETGTHREDFTERREEPVRLTDLVSSWSSMFSLANILRRSLENTSLETTSSPNLANTPVSWTFVMNLVGFGLVQSWSWWGLEGIDSKEVFGNWFIVALEPVNWSLGIFPSFLSILEMVCWSKVPKSKKLD